MAIIVDDSLKGVGDNLPLELSALTPGEYVITAALDACVRDAASAVAGDGRHAHPIFAFVMALDGLGESVQDVYARVGASLADGPVLASCQIDYKRPLMIGETYHVIGRIAGLVVKSSRRFGQTRHMTQKIDISDRDGWVAHVELTAVIPWKNRS